MGPTPKLMMVILGHTLLHWMDDYRTANPEGTPHTSRSPQFIEGDVETKRGEGSCLERAGTTTCQPVKNMLLQGVSVCGIPLACCLSEGGCLSLFGFL